MAEPAAPTTPVDDAPTQLSGPPGGVSVPSPRAESEAPSGATGAPTLTPLEVLRRDEVMRMRRFLGVGMALMVAAVVLLQFLHGDPFLEALLYPVVAVTFAAFLGFLLYIRDERRYSQDRGLVVAVIGIGAATLAVNYFGLLSPAPMIFMLGIYFFSLGSSMFASVVGYLLSAVPQALGMAAIAFGLMQDRGVVAPRTLPLTEQLAILVIVQAVYAATFVFARMSRQATLTAVAGLEQALRQVGQREALLQEAHQDLEKVLRAGRPGRSSGNRVGPWMISHVIGRGSMGEVYEARHVDTHQPAAIKLLLADGGLDGDRMRRFLREAEITSKLESPHIVRVYDVGDGTRDLPYLAMELLRGSDLGALLRKARRMPARRTVELVEQVASALEKARAADIVHRDIKPSNLFYAEEGEGRIWKVLDFGISRLVSSKGTLTQGNVIGTPGYMSPEQAHGTQVDHRADVFSLGAIAYRCLTGRPPFSGDGSLKVMFDTVFTQPLRPGALVHLHEDVDLILAVALAKKPEERPARATELALDLGRAVEGQLPDNVRAYARSLVARQPWSE